MSVADKNIKKQLEIEAGIFFNTIDMMIDMITSVTYSVKGNLLIVAASDFIKVWKTTDWTAYKSFNSNDKGKSPLLSKK